MEAEPSGWVPATVFESHSQCLRDILILLGNEPDPSTLSELLHYTSIAERAYPLACRLRRV